MFSGTQNSETDYLFLDYDGQYDISFVLENVQRLLGERVVQIYWTGSIRV